MEALSSWQEGFFMSDHSGLRYFFDQSIINPKKYRWFSTLNESDFETRYTKGKENRVVDAPNRRVQVNHIVATIS